MAHLWKNTIGSRLFMLFFGLSMALLIILTSVYYNRATKQINGKVGEVATRNVVQAGMHLDLLLKGYKTLTKSIAGSPEIQLLASRTENNQAIRAIKDRTITNALGAIFYSWDDVIGIHVITDSGNVYSYGSGMAHVIDIDYRTRDWYDKIVSSNGETVWLGMQAQSFIDRNEKKPVFAFGRQLSDINRSKSTGIILVEMHPTAVLDILDNLHLSPNSEQVIVDGRDRVVARQELGKLGQALPAALRVEIGDEDDVRYGMRNNGRELVVGTRLKQTDWSLVSATPKAELTVEINETKQFLLVIAGLLALLSAVLALLLSRAISRPIKKLINEMKRVEQGNFEAGLKVKSFEEINVLVHVFNRMVMRVNRLILRVRTVSASEKNAQLHVLQSQVNPHFLYNTLDMIYWMLDEEKEAHLGNVVHSLSHIFRYSSDWDTSKMVPIWSEMEQIDRYLYIVKTRMDDLLHYETNIAPEWRELRVPKMILQPIVENAVIHGLDKKISDEIGAIVVSTELDGEGLLIHVSDNGAGIPEEGVRGLRRKLAAISEEESVREQSIDSSAETDRTDSYESDSRDLRRGIGMENVHRRLLLRFGPRYGLRVDSAPERGTRVTLRIPAYPVSGGAPGSKEGGDYA